MRAYVETAVGSSPPPVPATAACGHQAAAATDRRVTAKGRLRAFQRIQRGEQIGSRRIPFTRILPEQPGDDLRQPTR
jgi:hypothetical protein